LVVIVIVSLWIVQSCATSADHWILQQWPTFEHVHFPASPVSITGLDFTGGPNLTLRWGRDTRVDFSNRFKRHDPTWRRAASGIDGVTWIHDDHSSYASLDLPPGIIHWHEMYKRHRAMAIPLREVTSARRQFPLRLDLLVWEGMIESARGDVARSNQLLGPLANNAARDWREEFLLTMAEFTRDVANKPSAVPSDTWEKKFPNLYGQLIDPPDFHSNAKRHFADWRSWDNPPGLIFSRLNRGEARRLCWNISAEILLEAFGSISDEAIDVACGMLTWKPGGTSEASVDAFFDNSIVFDVTLETWHNIVLGMRHDAATLGILWNKQEAAFRKRGWEDDRRWEILIFSGVSLEKVSPPPVPLMNRMEPSANERRDRYLTLRDLLRDGVRITHYRRERGAWPRADAAGQWPDLLLAADPIPKDWFDDGAPLKWIAPASDDESFIVYSIGPDKSDNGAQLDYSKPKPGMKTIDGTGDIILTLVP